MFATERNNLMSALVSTIVMAGSLGPAAAPARAERKDATMEFSSPENDEDTTVTVKLTNTRTGRVRSIPVMLPANCDVFFKTELIAQQLESAGYAIERNGIPGEATSFVIKYLDSKTEITMDPGDTNETDVVKSTKPIKGDLVFTGHFDPFDQRGLPAVFTCGIVTDVGVLSTQISAQELDFQTDGPIICQALYQRLAPRAPQYGAQINYAGDRLEVYFDPAYTVTQGGVMFGNTSVVGGENYGSTTLGVPEQILAVGSLVRGQRCPMTINGAQPGDLGYFYYSTSGYGETFLGNLNVTLEIGNALTAGRATANSAGVVSINPVVPSNAPRNLSVYFQGVVVDPQGVREPELTNAVVVRVQ